MKSKSLYYNPDSKSWSEVPDLGGAGESSGKNKTWFSVKKQQTFKC